MTLLLPNKVWYSQTCFQCQKYLSYGPIEVNTERFIQIKCGRCNEGENLHTPSIYNDVAKHLIFPCINRYEGCNQLLRYDDVPNHEKRCIGVLYKCPLCSTSNFTPNSLLYLLKHYTIFHKTSILLKPAICLPLDSCFEHSFFYYDNSENFFVVIYVQLDCAKLRVNVSTVGDRIGRLQYCVRIIKDGKQEFLSGFRACTSFDNNSDLFAIDLVDFIKNTLSSLTCELDFDTSRISYPLCLPYETTLDNKEVPAKEVCPEHYGRGLHSRFEDTDLKKKFPSIYVPDNEVGMEVRVQNDIYYLNAKGKDIYFFCSLCQNYCFLEEQNMMLCCVSCRQYTCRTCVNNCKTVKCGSTEVCMYCKKAYDISRQCSRSNILFYCSYGCKKFYKGNELGPHESNCYLNKAQFSNRELAQITFGKYFRDSSDESMTLIYNQNTILIDNDILKDNGKIYMLTDTFHCLIFYKRQELLYRFQVAHKYLPNKFYIHIKIFQDGAIREEINNFSVIVKKSSFIVVLLKVNDEYKRMIEEKKYEIEKIERERIYREKIEREKIDRENTKMEKMKRTYFNIAAIIFALAGVFYFVINKF